MNNTIMSILTERAKEEGKQPQDILKECFKKAGV